MVIQFTVLLSMCWHNNHKASYRDNTRTQGKYTNNKQQMKTNRKKIRESHLKNKIINSIMIVKKNLLKGIITTITRTCVQILLDIYMTKSRLQN